MKLIDGNADPFYRIVLLSYFNPTLFHPLRLVGLFIRLVVCRLVGVLGSRSY